MPVTVNHTGITVFDLDRAVEMFRDLFEFECFDRAPRDPAIISAVTGVAGAEVDIAYIRNGPHALELLCYSKPDDRKDFRPRPCDLGSLHLAMNVDDIDDVVERAKRWSLALVGEIVVIDQGPNTGSRIAYLRNPDDGLIIEVIQKARKAG